MGKKTMKDVKDLVQDKVPKGKFIADNIPSGNDFTKMSKPTKTKMKKYI